MCTPGASCDIRERKTGPASDLCCCRVSCLPNDTAALGSRASRCVLERPRRQKRRQLRAHIAQQKTCRLRHRQVMMACHHDVMLQASLRDLYDSLLFVPLPLYFQSPARYARTCAANTLSWSMLFSISTRPRCFVLLQITVIPLRLISECDRTIHRRQARRNSRLGKGPHTPHCPSLYLA